MTQEPSEWYPLLTAAAAATGLPWWLLYGVVEQESAFDPNSESSCGALGLMQLMPSTFPAASRAQLLDPKINVALGSEFLRECIAIWKRESPDEAIKFGLACYNGGDGYVLRAQEQAQAAGQDAAQWANVQPRLASVTVNGKHPDVEQITDYVRRIWTKFQARKSQPAPGGAAV